MLAAMPSRRVRFWRPLAPSVAYMVHVQAEDRLRVSYGDHFHVVTILDGAFDGWYRGAVHAQVPGALKLKDPGEVHRQVRVHAPFTLEAICFAVDAVRDVARAKGLRGPPRFRAGAFGPGSAEAKLGFAMRRALVDPHGTVLERETRIAAALDALLDADGSREPRSERRATRSVRRALDYLQDALSENVTLDELAVHAGLDKYHLVRAFKAELGVPPHAWLVHARVARARELLRAGERVTDVAHAVGFYDQSQLHRHFRRIVGVPPGAFARQVRPSAPTARAARSSA
jgi:AraC-like DNA-binding protein